jgi:Tfp pilus assembly protein PilP
MGSSRGEHQAWLVGGALLLVALLSACGSTSDASLSSVPPARRAPRPAPDQADLAAVPGLIQAPSPEQVVQAQSTGRLDPFAPVQNPRSAASGTAKDALPELRLTGLISSGRQAQALVEIGSQSGTVCVGRRGLCPGAGQPALLPVGWSVTGIDLGRGQLVVFQGGQRRVFSL